MDKYKCWNCGVRKIGPYALCEVCSRFNSLQRDKELRGEDIERPGMRLIRSHKLGKPSEFLSLEECLKAIEEHRKKENSRVSRYWFDASGHTELQGLRYQVFRSHVVGTGSLVELREKAKELSRDDLTTCTYIVECD